MVAHAPAGVALFVLLGAWGCKNRPAVKPDQISQAKNTSDSVPAVGAVLPPEGQPAGSKSPSSRRILLAIDSAMRKVKPDIDSARIVSTLPVGHSKSEWYAMLVVARGPHHGWARLADVGEVYAVFLADSAMITLSQPIDLFESRRMLDYEVRLMNRPSDWIIVCARGEMYGDQYMKREIPLNPGSHSLEGVRVDTSLHEFGEIDPVCGPTTTPGDLM